MNGTASSNDSDRSTPDVVVCRHLTEGWILEEGWTTVLADEIQDRLPETNVTIAKSPAEMKRAVADKEIVVTLEFSDEILSAIDSLQWVQALTAGVDGYDLDTLRSNDVLLTAAAGVHSKPITQQVFGFLLAFERGIKRGMELKRSRIWEAFGCDELTNKTLGIVGLGNVGRRVATVGSTFGMDVIGVKRNTDVSIDGVDEILPPDRLDEVLVSADYVVLACPLTEQTRGLLDREGFETMKESALLVNVARGEVVDEPALVDALRSDEIRGAGLDVFTEEPLPEKSPLWDLPNVLITPHNAGSGPYYWDRCAKLFAENYDHYVCGDRDAMRNREL